MALKAIVDSVDDLSEDVRSHYTQGDDGKYRLGVDPVDGYALEDIGGLKSALGKERTAREAAEGKISKYGDLDPDEARKAMERIQELSEIDPEKEADKLASEKVKAATSKMTEAHRKELEERDARVKALQGNLENVLVDQAATAALAKHKGSVDLLLPHVRSRSRVVEQDGKFVTQIVDANGDTQFDSKGNPLTIDGLVAEMRESESFGRAFEASGNSGTGAKPGGGSPGTMMRGNVGGNREERTQAFASKFKLPER